MENQITSRHTELLYWSTLEDILNKNYSVRRLKTFKYASEIEIELWTDSRFSNESIAFYVFLDELKKNISFMQKEERLKNRQEQEEYAKTRLLSMFRILTLSYAANYLVYDAIHAASEKGMLWADSMLSLLSSSKTIVEKISKEMQFSDPNFFVQEIFGSIRKSQSSTVIQKIAESHTLVKKILVEIKESDVFELFFDFSGNLRAVFSAHMPASENEDQIIFFKDGAAWIDNSLESSFYSIIFASGLGDEKVNNLLFLEQMRLYYKQSDKTIKKLRGLFLSQIAKGYIESKVQSSDFFLLSMGVTGGYAQDEIESFLAKTYNMDVVMATKGKILDAVSEELASHKKQLYFSNAQSSAELHKIAFSNIIEKAVDIYKHGSDTALLSMKFDDLKKEPFVIALADTLKDAYIDFVKKEQ
jgi:hypothetical protein